MGCEPTVHRVHRIDRNHYFSSRLQALLLCGDASVLQAVGSNGLFQHTQLPYALASFPRFGKHYSYVAFGKIHFFIRTVTSSERRHLSHVRRGASYPSGHSLPLLCLASLSALALVHVLSVALLQPVSSILLSFAGDALPSVDLLALRSHLLLNAAALAQGNSRDLTAWR